MGALYPKASMQLFWFVPTRIIRRQLSYLRLFLTMLPEATSGPIGFVPQGTVGRKRPVLYGATYTQLNLGSRIFRE